MTIKLSRPFASNSAVEEFDLRQMKKTLNRLGYYTPFEKTGITGISDREVFEALKEFQKDNNLPATGTAKPDDETIDALNREADKTPDGYYIWRTVEDGHVRPAHAKFNRTVRRWSDSPDPGDDFNCRCWAEKVPEKYEVQIALIKTSNDLVKFRNNKETPISALLLEHYLSKTGKKIILPIDVFSNSIQLKSALDSNKTRFEESFTKPQGNANDASIYNMIKEMKNGEHHQFSDYWDKDINIRSSTIIHQLDDPDFFNAIGSVKIRSRGNFRIEKKNNTIYIQGTVLNYFDDIYDFNNDTVADQLIFHSEFFLAKEGYAKPFEIHWEKLQSMSGEIRINGDTITKSDFKWEDRTP